MQRKTGLSHGTDTLQPAEDFSETDDSLPETRLPRTFAAFEDRNFRWFFASLCGNFAAMNMQMFMRGWLVFEITGSYEKLGWMAAAGGAVGLIAAPLGGVVADRVRQKKHVIQYCQTLNGVVTLAVGLLIAHGALVFEHLLAASVLQGIAMNTMMPARQALTKDVVGLDRLTNAIALNTSGMNTARLLLPGLAGGLVAALGGGNGNIDPARWVYFVMSALYLWSVLSMFRVVVADRVQTEVADQPVLRELRLGFSYVRNTPVILMLLVCNFLMVFFSLPYFMLLPGFAKQILNAGPDKLGLLISISGIGSLIGSLLIASMSNRRRGRVLLFGALMLGVPLLLFSMSTNYVLSTALLALVGLGQSVRMSLSNVLIQSYVDDEYRGRVMSIYMLEMAFLGVSIYPISVMADVIGVQWAVAASACGLIVLVCVLFYVPSYRDLD
ncbi:MAG: MFS transporter [Pseudomonadales bacterium]|nr:MFS transporter [Pseudomonadales bacterium]MDP6469976.1 MFS transporter [Pseudomonadales bacterium]MDP6829144.1 MFS transporter [Pseudomonadales bacterium]